MPIEVVVYTNGNDGTPENVKYHSFEEEGVIDTGDPVPFNEIEMFTVKTEGVNGTHIGFRYTKAPLHPTPVITVVEDSKFDPFPYGLIKHSIFARRT